MAVLNISKIISACVGHSSSWNCPPILDSSTCIICLKLGTGTSKSRALAPCFCSSFLSNWPISGETYGKFIPHFQVPLPYFNRSHQKNPTANPAPRFHEASFFPGRSWRSFTWNTFGTARCITRPLGGNMERYMFHRWSVGQDKFARIN